MDRRQSDLIDRYLRGEASAEEERDLVRQSMHDPELFDLLATVSQAEATMRREPYGVQATSGRLSRRMVVVGVGCLLAASVLVFVLLPQLRSGGATRTPESSNATTTSVTPPLSATRPVFLSARLELPSVADTKRTYRTAGTARLLAKAHGTLVVGQGGVVMVDLGALDGLKPDDVLLIEAGATAALPALRARVAAVYREESRLDVAASVGNDRQIRLDSTTHLNALSDQINDGTVAGDAELVRAAASRASTVARDPTARADARRKVLVQLAALAKARGDGAATEQVP